MLIIIFIQGEKMTIQDKNVKRWLRIANCTELTESLKTLPENERDGRSDLQILADEVSYRLSLYTEGGTCTGGEYEEAVQFLKEIRGGKIPCWNTIPPVPKYTPIQLENKTEDAKAVVNEYKRLKSLMSRLNERGYYGRWL